MKKYDVVVIGAGNGGLAAACRILNAGYSCLVCEKHNIPGGFATSFVRGRFEFEASLHELNGIGKEGAWGSTKALFDDLGISDKIKWYQVPDAFRVITKDEGLDFSMPFGIDNIIKACDTLCENGGAHAKRFLDLAQNVVDAIAYITEMKGHPDKEVMMSKYYDYLACSSYSVNEVFKSLHTLKIIRNVLSAYWTYLGCDFNQMSFIHYANMCLRYYTMGAVAPDFRSHGLSLAFEERIHELGGDIFFNTEVTNILTDGEGAVCGVRLANGEEIETKHVIANLSPHTVYGRMMDPKAVPERALKLENFRRFNGRGLTIFLGLNKSAEELGIKDHSYFIYKSSNNVKMHKDMKKLDHLCGQATCCLNNVVPDASPKGTCILYMTTLYFSDCWSKVKEEDYYKFKNAVSKRMIEMFEDYTGISISDSIEEIAVATPETYARYCGHPQGTIYGYDGQYYDSLMERIAMAGEDCPVKGLRMGGGFGERNDGFSSSYKSGYNEAGRTLKDIKKEEENV